MEHSRRAAAVPSSRDASVLSPRPGAMCITITPRGGGSIITPARTPFFSGVPLFGPKPLKFYPAVGFYLGAKSIHEEGGRLGFQYLDAVRSVPTRYVVPAGKWGALSPVWHCCRGSQPSLGRGKPTAALTSVSDHSTRPGSLQPVLSIISHGPLRQCVVGPSALLGLLRETFVASLGFGGE